MLGAEAGFPAIDVGIAAALAADFFNLLDGTRSIHLDHEIRKNEDFQLQIARQLLQFIRDCPISGTIQD